MKIRPTRADVFGLVRPAVEAHTLGISSVEQILRDCGYRTVTAGAQACAAFGRPEEPSSISEIEGWIRSHRITILGFSYRLDPEDGAALFGRLACQMKARRLLSEQGGPVRALYFAGVPRTCELVKSQNPDVAGVFHGAETAAETLEILGIDPSLLPRAHVEGMAYDEGRLAFGRELIRKGDYLGVKPVDRSAYEGFGTRRDTLVARVAHSQRGRLPPLMRAHVGPYLPDRAEAVRLFLAWTGQLARSGFLDVLSIGTSQLTQSNFGEDWSGKANGGGVPINSAGEFAAVWEVARPMLVRAYAGTRKVPELARVNEEAINNAWHALSFWWFCQIDGRGPNTVRENLREHLEALRYIASVGKPFEPNIPHHFAFRGADDVTYVVSAVIAARVAKSLGIRHLLLQVMLNTPRYTWGVGDLAKARATLQLVRELEDDSFRVILQPRAGLDYFSPDLEKAKVQLAAVTALMDDIEPSDELSPPLIHVVSYSEGSHLATPAVVDESIKITRQALGQYRLLRSKGLVDDMTDRAEVVSRTAELRDDAREVLRAIEAHVPSPYTAEGLYRIFAMGFLPVPYLWECREEFEAATRWSTRVIRGSVKVVDENGVAIRAGDRMRLIGEGPGRGKRVH